LTCGGSYILISIGSILQSILSQNMIKYHKIIELKFFFDVKWVFPDTVSLQKNSLNVVRHMHTGLPATKKASYHYHRADEL